MKTLKLKGKWFVKFKREKSFGEWFDSSNVPSRTCNKYNGVIICTNDGSGLVPVRYLLPHQIYRTDLKDLVKAFPSTTDIVAIPVNSEDYLILWGRRYQ